MNDFSNKNNLESIIASPDEIILKGESLYLLAANGYLDLKTLELKGLICLIAYCSYEMGKESVYKIIAECV